MSTTPTRKAQPGRRARRLQSIAVMALLGTALVGCSSGGSSSAEKEKAKRTTSTTTVAPQSGSSTVGSGSNAGAGTTNNGSSNTGQSGNGQTSGGASTTPAPTIVSFTTPEDIDCHNGNLQNFSVSWATTNAVKVTISIDGPGVYDTYAATGDTSLPFNCSSSHTFLLTAYNQDGKTATRTITLQPRNVQTSTPDPDQP